MTCPETLRHGLFAAPVYYRRGSGCRMGSPTQQADAKKDQRGFAIKLRGVPGAKAASPRSGRWTAQDFVLASAPCFFIRNADDYVSFVQAQVKRPAWRVLGFFFGLEPVSLAALRVSQAVGLDGAHRRPSDRTLLESGARTGSVRRWSKYSGDLPRTRNRPGRRHANPDYLRARLADRLARAPSTFDFTVQVQSDAGSDAS